LSRRADDAYIPPATATGRQVFSVTVDEDILSQPVVNGDGHVYVATAKQLIRID
jgi:hypothetical protein